MCVLVVLLEYEVIQFFYVVGLYEYVKWGVFGSVEMFIDCFGCDCFCVWIDGYVF